MSTDKHEDSTAPMYRVISVEKTDPPEGMPDGNWHRYVVGQGKTTIEGFKSDSLQAVTEHAESFAQDLTARAVKGYTTYAARKRK